MNRNFKPIFKIGAVVILAATSISPAILSAQALEEIVVTAQRREQTLQEVPISIETMSGDEIRDQNFRNMEDLSQFSPSVFIQSGVQDQAVAIRGVGTIGNSLTLEQAVPIFVDGIHYGRQSQIKTAFLDVDRVEILKGPQPVFFGQNASAGAFNILSKGPTDSWEGDVGLNYGNNGTREINFGAGGPINDTWGIRVAGAREESEGFLKNIVTGDPLPNYDYTGGRVTLQWTPSDNLQVTSKLEGSRLRNGSEAVLGCLTRGSMLYGRDGVTQDYGDGNGDGQGNERSIWKEAPLGGGFYQPFAEELSTECFKGNTAISNEGPYLLAPDNIYEENSSDGSVNALAAANAFASTKGGGFGYDEGVGGADSRGLRGQDYADAYSVNLDVVYTLDNEITINWLSGYNYYWRNAAKDNSMAPFFMNFQGREENFDQWSTELRFTSPAGGTIEWMTGVSLETNAKDNWSSSLRPNVRRAQRFNWLWEDATVYNAFATLTFNFFDDRASLDIGGRYSHLKKEVFVTGYGATWVFDVEPVSAGGDAVMVDSDDVRILVPGADLTNLWTIPYRDSRNTPDEWYPSTGVEAVGMTAPDFTSRLNDETDDGAALTEKFTDDFIDPQVTLRYRLNDNHSLFARYAKASKGAGYDTGQTSIPANLDEMKFEAEHGQTYEVGSKGSFWDNRARYDVTVFRTDFTDLQLSGLAPISNQDSTSISLNAGKQRVEGVEFSVLAQATEQFRVGLSGAIMDGTMIDFQGSGCNAEEVLSQAILTGEFDGDPVTPSGFDLPVPTPGLNICDLDTELTDRSGDQAPRTPDWKFVLTTNYVLPVFNNYELSLNTKGFYSDGFITARDSFSKIVMYNKHGDINVSVGFGDSAGIWKLSAYANNLLEARESYNGEFDVRPDGLETSQVVRSNFTSYGVKFNYNFQ